MHLRVTLLVVASLLSMPMHAQETTRYRAAVVALTDDPELRAEFERTLVEKAKQHNYDAVTSYDLAPDVDELDENRFLRLLASQGIEAVLMLRPASIGEGASLESVRNEVSPELFADMQAFAEEVSSPSGDGMIAVVHMAIYTLTGREPNLISAGAVWLDEEVESQTQAIERLQDLIVSNVDAVRPAIRRHLGLPPLE